MRINWLDLLSDAMVIIGLLTVSAGVYLLDYRLLVVWIGAALLAVGLVRVVRG